MTDESNSSADAWHDVGDQFRVLGESLASAFRTAWESEDTRRHAQELQTGLERMIGEVGRVMREVGATPEAEAVRDEVHKATTSARAAGQQAWQEAQPHVLSALRQVNAELQKIVARMEEREPGSEADID